MVDPFEGYVVWGENTDDEAEPGLVEEEPQLDSNGLMESPDRL